MFFLSALTWSSDSIFSETSVTSVRFILNTLCSLLFVLLRMPIIFIFQNIRT